MTTPFPRAELRAQSEAGAQNGLPPPRFSSFKFTETCRRCGGKLAMFYMPILQPQWKIPEATKS